MSKNITDVVYKVAIDEDGQVVDLPELQDKELAAVINKCGKLAPGLCENLPTKADEEMVRSAYT